MTKPAPLDAEFGATEFDYAVAMQQSDQEILQIIAQPFRVEWLNDRQHLLDGLNGDLSKMERTAHALKGTLAMFGAQPAALLAARLERAAQSGDDAHVRALVDSLVVEVERMILAIP